MGMTNPDKSRHDGSIVLCTPIEMLKSVMMRQSAGQDDVRNGDSSAFEQTTKLAAITAFHLSTVQVARDEELRWRERASSLPAHGSVGLIRHSLRNAPSRNPTAFENQSYCA
jgi:hypothetical protein